MARRKIAVTGLDDELAELVEKTDQKILMTWACDCAERVLSSFENSCPEDRRPRAAVEAGREWLSTGVFRMAVIRKASLDAHSAARDVEKDDVARSAARAAGQAVATAHVPRHALGAALYAATAVYCSVEPADADAAAHKEREWQIEHLKVLSGSSSQLQDIHSDARSSPGTSRTGHDARK